MRERIVLRDLLSVPLSDTEWQKIAVNNPVLPQQERLIINCEGVNPNDLNSEQVSYLFFYILQNQWQVHEYTDVFRGCGDEFSDFLDDVIERRITVNMPNINNNQELSSGTTLDNRYKIISSIGHGNFGQTYLAEDLRSPTYRKCVVKQFKPIASQQGTISVAKSLFEREAKTLEQLQNPCIPKLLAYFEENKELYLVQEYIDGTPLDKLVQPNRPRTQQELINILKDILEPLNYLHERNIIHRDIKPSNLIRRNQDNKIVLIDFGAVKATTVLNPNGGQNKTIIGTAGYMPPEQSMGNPCLSSDIYAVGMVAIQAATGLNPLDLPRDSQTQELIWQDKALQLEQGLKDILQKMVCYNCVHRYPTAKETLEAIKEWEDSPQPPPPPPRLEKLLVALKEKKSIVYVGGVLGLAVIALGLKSLPYFHKAKISTDTVTIGTLWTPESYTKLTDHLKEELVPANYFDYLQGKKITVIINGDKTLDYEEARNRIKNKQWDVAFTNSPINSIFAKEQGYSYVGAMFPDSPGYQGGLFVTNDSAIQSIDDIKPDTKVALGSFNSASSFYVPAYALYGKTISVDLGNRGQKIIQKVKNGEVDVGAAAIGDSIKRDDPALRIIYVSSQIPGAGVYLSPNLSTRDQDALKKVMSTASKEAQKDANYGVNTPEPDYTEFKKVIARVDNILVCSDFQKNPVNLYCPNGDIYQLSGVINGATIKANNYLLRVVSTDKKIYNVAVPKTLVAAIFGSDDLKKLQNQPVDIRIPSSPEGSNINITQSRQLRLKQ